MRVKSDMGLLTCPLQDKFLFDHCPGVSTGLDLFVKLPPSRYICVCTMVNVVVGIIDPGNVLGLLLSSVLVI